MKRFIPAVLIAIVFCGIAWAMLQGVEFPATQKAQALGPGGMTMLPTSSPLPTNTPEPTYTPYPTVDYRATDQAYQLAMEQERNRMIEVQLQHDENMLAQQVELARVNGTATAAGTQIAQVNAQNTLTAGQLTLGAGMLTATAQAPARAAELWQVENNAKTAKGDRIIYVVGVSVVIFVLVCFGLFLASFPKLEMKRMELKAIQQIGQENQQGIDVTLRDEKNPETTVHRVLPCTIDQLMELAEMVVNGRYTFAYNDMEKNSRTFRGQRDVLEETRDVLEALKLAIHTENGESVVNHRGKQFFEYVFETHELPEGFQIGEMA